MSKTPYENARRQTQRVAVLKKRMRWIKQKWGLSPNNGHLHQELSALEWAIPILELHLTNTYGALLPERGLWGSERHAVVNALLRRDGDICYLCEQKIERRRDMTVDHVIPLAKNGEDRMSNYKLTHEACNVAKGNMLLEVYREWQTGKRKVTDDNLA